MADGQQDGEIFRRDRLTAADRGKKGQNVPFLQHCLRAGMDTVNNGEQGNLLRQAERVDDRGNGCGGGDRFLLDIRAEIPQGGKKLDRDLHAVIDSSLGLIFPLCSPYIVYFVVTLFNLLPAENNLSCV